MVPAGWARVVWAAQAAKVAASRVIFSLAEMPVAPEVPAAAVAGGPAVVLAVDAAVPVADRVVVPAAEAASAALVADPAVARAAGPE